MTAPISPILQRILDFAPLLNAPPPPACLRCAADVWARLQASTPAPVRRICSPARSTG